MTRTAVLYARVSGEEQVRGYSLRQQLATLREWCAREGYEVLAEVEDPGHSGAYLERPGLDRVRDLVAEVSGRVDVVVAQDADRITRDPMHRGFLDDELERYGCRLVALDDWGDDSHEGQLLKYMKGWVSKGERLKISERTRRGIDRKVREGKLVRGGRAPYGFRYTDDGDALVVDGEKMRTVGWIFRLVGQEGETLGALVKRLTREGVPSPTGGLWHRPTLRYLILNELYRPLAFEEAVEEVPPEVAAALNPEGLYGLWCFNKRRQERWRERDPNAPGGYRDRYKMVYRPREEWTNVPIPLDGAGLSRVVVDAARERISDNRRRPASTVASRFWQLSGGIARCAECGSVLSPSALPRRGGKGHRFYMVCRQRYGNGARDCPSTWHSPAAPLEEAVWREVRGLLSEPERVMVAYDAYVERRKAQLRGDPDRETRELAEKLHKLERRRSGYLDLAADGDMGREDLRCKLAEVDGQSEGLLEALREAKDRGEAIEKLRQDREMLAGRFSAMRGIDLRNLGPEDRRRVMEALRLRVEVDKEGDARISGVFDADVTELLPMDQAPAGEPYAVRFRREIPPPHGRAVTLDTTGRCGG